MEIPKYTIEALEMIVQRESANKDIGRKGTKMLHELRAGDKVCLLNNALYGLRQARRCWNAKVDEELLRFGAGKSNADPCVYFKGKGKNLVLISVYVDDILIASRDQNEITKFGKYLSKVFEVRDLGPVRYCLGMEFRYAKPDTLTISSIPSQ